MTEEANEDGDRKIDAKIKPLTDWFQVKLWQCGQQHWILRVNDMKEMLKNLYTVLMCVLIVLVAIATIGLKNGIQTRILVTSSMQSAVNKGSLVLLNIKTPWEELEEGDIIAFRSSKTEVMHRVTAVTDEGLILRPDNGNGESFVTRDMYVGKEIIAFPYIGGMIKPVILNGNKFVIGAAIAMILVGCWGLGKKTGDNISS